MFCMVVIIATLPAQCKSFFLIPKKIMGFSDNQEIFLEKSTFLLSFVCVFAGFSQISSKKSFSRKNIPRRLAEDTRLNLIVQRGSFFCAALLPVLRKRYAHFFSKFSGEIIDVLISQQRTDLIDFFRRIPKQILRSLHLEFRGIHMVRHAQLAAKQFTE